MLRGHGIHFKASVMAGRTVRTYNSLTMHLKNATAPFLLFALLLSACNPAVPPVETPGTRGEEDASVSGDVGKFPKAADFIIGGVDTADAAAFEDDVPYEEPSFTINPALAADFPLEEVKNIAAITEAYGITLSEEEQDLLARRKFLLKRLPETTILPKLTDERGREFLGLYNAVAGTDAKSRTQANTLFWSADIFLHSYTLLATELIKEMENTVFAPAMRTISGTFYEAAAQKLEEADDDAERMKWRKVRNYFAVPHALFSTAIPPLTAGSYVDANGVARDPVAVRETFEKEDKAADTEQRAAAFIGNLGLDEESKSQVLQDIHNIFEPQGPDIPSIFKPEYEEYAAQTGIVFSVDFTQFTPRSHYTGSSFRRQYFRAMNWYIQLPFFVRSDQLTEYAFAISQLLAEHPEHLRSYNLLESTINFLVGVSDDLMPADYLRALEETKGKSDQAAEIRQYLLKAKQPRIKSIAAQYPSVGEVQSADVTAATSGMRFFSGKFILDSYWTDFLTQGDEAPLPGYPAKLPPMASSLEVMALLGSDYARQMIPTLDFRTPDNGAAIEKALQELEAENAALTQKQWRENAYTTALWTIRGLFEWEREHQSLLPRFMQNEDWPAKTLMTAAGFWTEMRHAVLLYAKQSFAEKGGGGACDSRKVPDAPKAYIEPQPLAYRRLHSLAQRTLTGLRNLGFTLQNFDPLTAYISTMEQVIAYTDRELANTALIENVQEHRDADIEQPNGTCIWYEITDSDWETLRRGLVDSLDRALPRPVEGPVLPAKDKRAALVADVHTGGDSSYEHRILYQGTGVPYVILVAVKDSNGPRLAIGFTYSHFEFTELLGGKRLTDEGWQERFYVGDDMFAPFQYTDLATWPALNHWYSPLFPSR